MSTEEARSSAREVGQKLGEEQKRTLAHEVLGVARALEVGAEELERENHPTIADFASRAAEAARRFGRDIEGKGFKEILAELEQLGREHPTLLAAGAALVGFLATRVVRASSGDSETTEEGVESHGVGL